MPERPGSRTPRLAPPFSGRGTFDIGDAWPIVRVRDESAGDTRRPIAERATSRRWQTIDSGLEEWGRGSLVVVGAPRRSPAAAGPSHAADAPAPEGGSAMLSGPDGARVSGSAARSERPRDEAEAVALALETVALRVRVGEFRVRGLVPGMSDAAILAATLASILAPRR